MYTPNKEDEFYAEYLDLSKKDGKYIDIGSGVPIEGSNTYYLYTLGWKGLCVDPNFTQVAWDSVRLGDILVSGAIADTDGELNMSDTLLEGFNEGDYRHTAMYPEYVKNYGTRKVPCTTFAKLLEKYPDFYSVDLLSIDVELSEARVLSTVDFSKFTPRLIVIESWMRGVSTKPLWEHFLLPFYSPVREFPGNTFYLRKS